MAIDFKTAISIVPHVMNVRKPVLFRGRHGIGKSEVVYQIAKERGLPVVERRASQMTEGDLVGLPSTDGNITSFNPPDWYAQACSEPVLLFLDEVDRAVAEVRQGIFELTDSRKLNGHTLHEDTLVFACVNGGEHGAQYQVGEMDPAELDRWTTFDLEPSVEDWLSWAEDNVNPLVVDFIKLNPGHLEHSGEYEPNKVYPSRRSWKRCNDAADGAGLLADRADLGILFTLASAFVGAEAAMELQHFVRNYDRMLSPEDIIDKGKVKAASKLEFAEQAAMVDKIVNTYLKDGLDFNDTQRQNMAEFFAILPAEIGMKFWGEFGASLGNGDYQKGKQNFLDFHETVLADGRKISKILEDYISGGRIKS
jgi:hypothetical protein